MGDARLTTLLKGETEADGLRPVASGEVLRRVVGRAMIQAAKDEIETMMLEVNQLSFSSDGCLIAYTLLRHLLEENPNFVVAATDEHTAFQLQSREEMKRQLLGRLRDFVPYFDAAYGDPAGLHYEGRRIPDAKAGRGCQQGCAIGNLCYCLAKLEQLRELKRLHPQCLIVVIVDDVFIGGEPADVAAAFVDWRRMTEDAGCVPNLGKCKFWGPIGIATELASSFQDFAAGGTGHPAVQALAGVRQPDGSFWGGVEVVPASEGIKVLGHPLGSDAYCKAFYMAKAEKSGRLVDSVSELACYGHDTAVHGSYLLLRYCAEPRIAHLL